MRKTKILCGVFFSLLFSFAVSAQNSTKQNDLLEQEIRRLDLAEAEAILKKDFAALDKITSPDFTTNSPRGEIVKGKEELKELMRKGVVDYASFVRGIEAVLIYGETIVTMGRETVVTKENPSQSVQRRYTNVWMKRGGKWLLTARHANVVPVPPAAGQKEPRAFTGDWKNFAFDLASADWSAPYDGPLGIAKGARRAVVGTDAATGGETYYAWFPAGSLFKLHWHASPEYAVVLRGKVTALLGTEKRLLAPGDYLFVPARTNHGWQIEAGEDAYLLIRRDGPADFNFVEKQ
ncbi:MAG TPA: DUF4440 domain-containing protein [Pyrinomonadaceae bacterium]